MADRAMTSQRERRHGRPCQGTQKTKLVTRMLVFAAIGTVFLIGETRVDDRRVGNYFKAFGIGSLAVSAFTGVCLFRLLLERPPVERPRRSFVRGANVGPETKLHPLRDGKGERIEQDRASTEIGHSPFAIGFSASGAIGFSASGAIGFSASGAIGFCASGAIGFCAGRFLEERKTPFTYW
ncbi:unnamed protein product [Darwinula stevensoni]|uniref:Uncharacterized protein n=1 Tax=Darwinula stevensoni TaxID=69355 RepID=A0A7R8XCU6_9CRUS|nr:unnamed protein product [Darwinula stevensoni]CAG0892590.1 unnamed protein product [Darwinula stevensoni]